MDLLALLPDTHAGRHTEWLWSRMLAIAVGSLPPEPEELAEHFAPFVFDQVATELLIAYFAQHAPAILHTNRLIEQAASALHYSALLGSPDSWLRYTCFVQDEEPHLLIGAGFLSALDPNSYSDRWVQRNNRDVQIRDFGGTGPLMLLWHGSGGDCTHWETLVPHLTGFHLVAQDLPRHGQSLLKTFTADDTLADADSVIAELDQGPPIIVGHSLGGYVGLRYAATRNCAGWIGLDGPLGIAYPWDLSDAGFDEIALQVGREILAIDVAREFAAVDCPALLLLCAKVASPVEEKIVSGRRELAEHLARHHTKIRVEWIQTGHDTVLFDQVEETATMIREFLCQAQRI